MDPPMFNSGRKASEATEYLGYIILADNITNVNFGFEHFATPMGIYAATNPL